jgi:hypothetical protein
MASDPGSCPRPSSPRPSPVSPSGASPTPPYKEVRDRITPHAFGLDPTLLGLPLAGHRRRMGAMLVDIILVGLISNAGGVVLGLLAGLLLLRIALRTRPDQTPSLTRTAFQGSIGCMGALILFILVLSIWGSAQRFMGPPPPERTEQIVLSSGPELAALMHGAREIAALRAAESPDEVEERTGQLATRLEEMGLDADEAREVASQIAAEIQGEGVGTGRAGRGQTTSGEGGGEGRLRLWVVGIAEDLGLGLGWGALYFTVMLTWWKGQTPGKRLLGLRVVRLNGKPITWWYAFERYGGYAAGFATGLLGFAQVYWDANRQATHDKIAGTVVIRDGMAPLPLPDSTPTGPGPQPPAILDGSPAASTKPTQDTIATPDPTGGA